MFSQIKAAVRIYLFIYLVSPLFLGSQTPPVFPRLLTCAFKALFCNNSSWLLNSPIINAGKWQNSHTHTNTNFNCFNNYLPELNFSTAWLMNGNPVPQPPFASQTMSPSFTCEHSMASPNNCCPWINSLTFSSADGAYVLTCGTSPVTSICHT